MSRMHMGRHGFRGSLVVMLAGALAAACTSPDTTGGSWLDDPGPVDPVDPVDPDVFVPGDQTPPSCDPARAVESDGSALLVTDPAVLERFQLERVLQQLIDNSPGPGKTPLELLQRLFDTENSTADAVFADNMHCDSLDNPAFKNGPSAHCPRAEGALAKSAGLFDPAHPDYLAPVALVNRMDLMPQSLMTCGEFRIVYAKASGRTNPSERVFLILEGALTNPTGAIEGCMPAANLWASLEAETEPEVIAGKLEKFYFEGLPGLFPLVHPDHFGVIGGEDDPYGATRGQIRLSQHMQDPWVLREFRASIEGGVAPLSLRPVTVKNNPLPELFDASQETSAANEFRMSFLGTDLILLGGASSAATLQMQTANLFNAGESAIDVSAETNYLTRAQTAGNAGSFMDQVATQAQAFGIGANCPAEDPLDSEALVARAAVQTCAGCHAPAQFVGAERRLGCGMTFPESLGEVHIDENGMISPALEEVFLPRRANVMSTYLQFCDIQAIFDNLQGGKAIPK